MTIALLTIIVLMAIFTVGTIFWLFTIKKISQLSIQNKLLSALQELDRILLEETITEIDVLAKMIVNLAKNKLGYFYISIAMIDQKAQGVKRIAISDTPGLDEVFKFIPISFNRQIVPFSEKENLIIRSINERKGFRSNRLYDIQRGIFEPEISDKIQKINRIKAVYVHPLISGKKAFGAISYGSAVASEKLTEFDFTVMQEFASEVARSLDHVLLYQNLKITSQKLAEANQKLKELDQLKDEFVSIASHELRTPMTAIRSYSWMALYKSDIPLSAKLKKYLYRTLVSTERLINLVSDMLNVSRIEAGRIEIAPKPFDIQKLVTEVMDEVVVKANEKSLHLEVKQDNIPEVFADSDKVHQVLLNLVGNALKFTPSGGTISVEFFTDGRMVETSVKDSGVGISKDDLSQLFKKFGRLDSSYVAISTSGGTGLGLYISKSLIELMHGRIRAASEGEGTGSTFTFSLPVATQEVLSQQDMYSIKPKGEAKVLEPVAI